MDEIETTSTQYSLNLTVKVHNVPGVLGRLTTAIGAAGGNIFAINNFVVRGPVLQRSIVVNCHSVEHQDEIIEVVSNVEGIELLEHYDRTFLSLIHI